jgi:hypothetical protein
MRLIASAGNLDNKNGDPLFVTVSRTLDGKKFTASYPLEDVFSEEAADLALQVDDVINPTSAVSGLQCHWR